MGDHAPTSHIAERAGYHFSVLALQGQGFHVGTQGDILGQLREGGAECEGINQEMGSEAGLGWRTGILVQKEGSRLVSQYTLTLRRMRSSSTVSGPLPG